MLFHENIRCAVYGFKAMSNDKSGKSYRDIIQNCCSDVQRERAGDPGGPGGFLPQ